MTIAAAGTPSAEPLTSGENVPGRPAIQAPPMTRNMIAENMYIEPSVAIIGGTFSFVTRKPFQLPSSVPVKSPSGATAIDGRPA
jgi:hypothetical protein